MNYNCDCKCDHNSTGGILKKRVSTGRREGSKWRHSLLSGKMVWFRNKLRRLMRLPSRFYNSLLHRWLKNTRRKPGFTETKLCRIHSISFYVGLLDGSIMYSFICPIDSYNKHLSHNYCVIGTILIMKIERQASSKRDRYTIFKCYQYVS